MSTKQRLQLEGRIIAMRRSNPEYYADQIAETEAAIEQLRTRTLHPTTTRRDERRHAERGR